MAGACELRKPREGDSSWGKSLVEVLLKHGVLVISTVEDILSGPPNKVWYVERNGS